MCFDSYTGMNEYGSEVRVSTGKCDWVDRKRAEIQRCDYPVSKEKVEPKKRKIEVEKEFSKPVFYRISEERKMISLYSAFGRGHCDDFGTKWCKKNCYMKTVPFTKSNIKKIQKVNVRSWNFSFLNELIDYFRYRKNIRYFTLFASGCIENLDTKDDLYSLLKRICKKYSFVNFRFFIRNPRLATELPENGNVILSIDNSTPSDVILEAAFNTNIRGIAIVNHPDNQHLISSFTGDNLPKNFVKIDCEDCKVHDTLECFNCKERFILIQDYKSK